MTRPTTSEPLHRDGVLTAVALASSILVAAAVAAYWHYLERDSPTIYADLGEHFKYGSFGAEFEGGIPLRVWQVLPIVFSDLLPGEGYQSLGFIYEDGRDTPIGAPVRTVGFSRVGLNCATCHVGTYRVAPGAPEVIVAGMPAHEIDLQAYLGFLSASAKDERFTPDVLLPAMEAKAELSLLDNVLYRYFIIPATRDALLRQAALNEWMATRPLMGPGRVDTLSPYKALLGIDLVTDDTSIGNADLMSLWLQGQRRGHWANWDGNNGDVVERNRAAALGAGATPATLDIPAIARMEDYIRDLAPPTYPFPVDAALAAGGGALFATHCASCHDFAGSEVGEILPIDDIGTDRHRFDAQTEALVALVNTFGAGTPASISHFRKSAGYLNIPLDGIWARAPYLHNGSVPTLTDLLALPEDRPAHFYRGYNVYDPRRVGFVSAGPGAEAAGFAYDTSLPGNGSGGHLYGTDLSPGEKTMLIEYLKTL